MFQKRKNDVCLLKKLRMTLIGLQAVLSDAENKQASNQFVSQWLNEFRHAVDSAENLMEEINYEALRIKVEGQHQNFAEPSNYQQVSDLNPGLSDDFFLIIKEKLGDTIETLKDLQEQIGDLGLKEHFGSTKQETRTPSTSLVDDSDIFVAVYYDFLEMKHDLLQMEHTALVEPKVELFPYMSGAREEAMGLSKIGFLKESFAAILY
ncbi:putative disease resistance RPP13-like protein 1 [Solanum stenotomum]|uniref:putative disease resistance RPP13-like protein 1 n=1 Tax=Solanum stenotomum TaxID=172797 RepID=UPI0020D13022|nr:putative disease resistance RPP13-like protein 1 [Solanum stenotomum]XP_049380860.1 putative disease resistance RPP13-like protein 1 [Solanum stenotomum]